LNIGFVGTKIRGLEGRERNCACVIKIGLRGGNIRIKKRINRTLYDHQRGILLIFNTEKEKFF